MSEKPRFIKRVKCIKSEEPLGWVEGEEYSLFETSIAEYKYMVPAFKSPNGELLETYLPNMESVTEFFKR